MKNNVYDYYIKFDEPNNNLILIYKENKLINTIATPPSNNTIDIINLFDDKMVTNYEYNFNGLVIITSHKTKTIYHKGTLIDSINIL